MSPVATNIKAKKKSDFFDSLILAVAIIEPLSTVPQIVDIYTTRDAHSLSLLSWVLFMAASVTWLIYGVRIRSVALIASSILWFTTELLLVFGIIVFS